MSTLPLVLGIAAVVAVPTAAFVIANEFHSLDDQGCAMVATEPYDAADARLVQVRIMNAAEAATLRVCANEDNGTERHQETIELAANSEHIMHVKISPATKRLGLEMDRPGYEYTEPVYAIVGAGWTLPVCKTGIADLAAKTEFYGNGSGVWSLKPTCVDAASPTSNPGAITHGDGGTTGTASASLLASAD